MGEVLRFRKSREQQIAELEKRLRELLDEHAAAECELAEVRDHLEALSRKIESVEGGLELLTNEHDDDESDDDAEADDNS
jgi:hypothetical protein